MSLTANVTGYLEEEDLEIGLGTCPVMENLLNCTHSGSDPSPTKKNMVFGQNVFNYTIKGSL